MEHDAEPLAASAALRTSRTKRTGAGALGGGSVGEARARHGGLDDLAMREEHYSYFVWRDLEAILEAAYTDAVTVVKGGHNVSACALRCLGLT